MFPSIRFRSWVRHLGVDPLSFAAQCIVFSSILCNAHMRLLRSGNTLEIFMEGSLSNQRLLFIT